MPEEIISRIEVGGDMAVVERLDLRDPDCHSLLGDNRELMRHGNGALHAALVETVEDRPRIGLFGIRERGAKWARLVSPISSPDSRGDTQPATDSNHNGTYVAFVQEGDGGKAGFVAHAPDPFGDPSDLRLHGPLTPPEGSATNSFLQGSRVFNSVGYAWRDEATGDVFVGVSRDGVDFPPARRITTDRGIVNGPAIGIRGDYVLCTYVTSTPASSPGRSRTATVEDPSTAQSHGRVPAYYYMFTESGDGGESWTDPAPLIPEAKDLPTIAAYSLTREDDLRRHDIVLEGAGPKSASLQALVWAPAVTLRADTRLFTQMSLLPSEKFRRKVGASRQDSVGVLAFKPIAVGGTWTYVLTNRPLFRRADRGDTHSSRFGTLYKYGALPDTAVRSLVYVERAPKESQLEDKVILLVSTNMGNSFDYELAFDASELGLERDARVVVTNSLCCFPDAEGDVWQDVLLGDLTRPNAIVHATLPLGWNVQGLDPTLTW